MVRIKFYLYFVKFNEGKLTVYEVKVWWAIVNEWYQEEKWQHPHFQETAT